MLFCLYFIMKLYTISPNILYTILPVHTLAPARLSHQKHAVILNKVKDPENHHVILSKAKDPVWLRRAFRSRDSSSLRSSE